MKVSEWKQYREKVLIPHYQDKQWCENCGSTFGLSFHHLERRSAGGKNSLDNIVLLCANCHHKADNASGYVEFNEYLVRSIKGK